MQYVFEVVNEGKTLGIYTTNVKAQEALDWFYKYRLYKNEPITDYRIRETVLDNFDE